MQRNSITVINPDSFKVFSFDTVEHGRYPSLQIGLHASILFKDWNQLEDLRDIINASLEARTMEAQKEVANANA